MAIYTGPRGAPSPGTPISPFDGVAPLRCTPDERRVCRRQIIELAHQLDATKRTDLTGLAASLRTAGAEVPALAFQENLSAVHFSGAMQILNEMARAVMLPQGEIFLVNYVGGPQIWSGRIKQKTWAKIDYVTGRPIWEAEVHFEKCPPESFGLSSGNYAFIDREKASADGQKMFRFLGTPKSVGLDRLFPYTAELRKLLGGNLLPMVHYAQYFSVERGRFEEINHCRDHVYLDLTVSDAPNLGARRNSFLALLRPGTEYYRAIEALSDWQNLELRRSGAVEFSAHISGVLDEMRGFLATGNPPLAYAAFLDFMVAIATKEAHAQVTYSEDGIDITGIYADVHRLLFLGLKELGIPDSDSLLSHILSGSEHPGVTAEKILTRAFNVFFLSPEEKRERAEAALVSRPR